MFFINHLESNDLCGYISMQVISAGPMDSVLTTL